MITEDYVSFETAKLLKEKGFYWDWSPFYSEQDKDEWNKNNNYNIPNPNYDATIPFDSEILNVVAPHVSLQMAMKWLREVHEIYIEIPIYSISKPVLYRWNAFKNERLVTDEEKPKNCNCIIKGDDNNPTVYYYKYEEACEAAIKYCLNNLI